MKQTTIRGYNDVIRKEILELMKHFKKKVKRIPPGVSGIDETKVISDWGWAGGLGHSTWI